MPTFNTWFSTSKNNNINIIKELKYPNLKGYSTKKFSLNAGLTI